MMHPAPVLPAVSDELLQSLPPVLRAVVQALGIVRAREWLQIYGGVKITLPQYKSSALALSQEELKALRHTLAPHMDADGRFWAPKADKIMIQVRDVQIRKERYTNSIRTLALRYHLSDRQILNICREDDTGQYVLF
jgi:hypothetical protein